VANRIAASLSQRSGAIPTLIAETGGINAMLVDSTALPEQVVRDVVQSAFNSAGQRCSALRVLYLQEAIADRVINLIKGRMDELVLGDPGLLETDVGPVINAQAKADIDAHISKAKIDGRLLYQVSEKIMPGSGYFVAPAMIAIDSIGELEKEVFGPVLHVIRFRADDILSLCDEINATGYALTFGIHSRINHRIEAISRRILAGNIYINRNMVGAVVESQPFGGSGLSGTGPKAGGPHYLARFAREQSISNNTAAIGGDPTVFSISE
jgi:RHH-type proline utilization regulon transcriptional repressor/proline dehydrogenase/delta 1-pyrroline-5-carboxylate dehydrogenase